MSELEPIDNAPSKTPWPKKVKAALGFAYLAAVAYTTQPGAVEAYVGHALGAETAQERLIGDAAARVYGKTVLVNCTNNLGLIFVRDPEVQGNAPLFAHSRVILLPPRVCDNLESFANGLNSQQSVSASEVVALHELSHELSHMKGNGNGTEFNERVAECYATQRLPEVAQAFGASPELANMLGQAGATEFSTGLQEYAPLPDCVDGGLRDLDPLNPGIFPQPMRTK